MLSHKPFSFSDENAPPLRLEDSPSAPASSLSRAVVPDSGHLKDYPLAARGIMLSGVRSSALQTSGLGTDSHRRLGGVLTSESSSGLSALSDEGHVEEGESERK